MSSLKEIKQKIYYSASECKAKLEKVKAVKVWTNGCFDIVHAGHIKSLLTARQLGDFLIVGLNSDLSVAHLKGADRPIKDEVTRALVLASFSFVDMVLLFDATSPIDELLVIRPDIFTKGAEYDLEALPEAQKVLSYGGQVKSLTMEENISTTDIINKIRKQ